MVKKNLSIEKTGKLASHSSLARAVSENNMKAEKKPEISETERKELYDNFDVTGDFEKDVSELAIILDIPLIVTHRPKLKCATPENTGKNKDLKRKTSVEGKEKVSESNEFHPTTFTINSNKDYFKPKIVVEIEQESSQKYVKEIFLRGWLADEKVMDIFSKTLPGLEKLVLLDMWNAGLTDETLNCLFENIRSLPFLKTLNLDGNQWVNNQRFDLFLLQGNLLSLQNLSLRKCNLSKIGMAHLGNALRENKTLLTINLSNNCITNQGIKHIADSLRMNRTLLSLDLSNNNITDTGVEYLTEVMTTFSLTHEEIVERRYLKSQYSMEESSECSDNSGSSREKKSKAKMAGTGKKNENPNSRGKEKSAGDTGKPNSKAKKGRSNSTKSDRIESPLMDDANSLSNTLLEKVRSVEGELWITGNRSLINLNLSRNEISARGLQLLYSAMLYQGDLASQEYRSFGIGLMRLNLYRNQFPSDDPAYTSLKELMAKRDPLYKPPMEDVTEENA